MSRRTLDAKEAPTKRHLDPERTRRDILAVARAEFAENGLSGARVDAIAAGTQTTKRMIYYYFGSKEGLYLAVLEEAYAGIRAFEKELALDALPPPEAIRRMVEFTFDYQEAHPDFIRLVSIENINHGKYIAQSEAIRGLNATVIDALTRVLDRGRAAGVFRSDFGPIDLHMLISAFCFFRVSNRYTFGTLFAEDFDSPDRRQMHKQVIVDAVLRLLEPRHKAEARSPRPEKAA
jgi:AcrR family transcriptional regulator